LLQSQRDVREREDSTEPSRHVVYRQERHWFAG
jgi:hypothetical protein